nr:transposase [Sporomusa acidovorans]
MPRSARIPSKTGIYHIMLRGNERRDIFLDDADKLTFIDFLYSKKADEGCLLYAYCLMDNHVHLVIKEGCNGIAKLMKRIGTSYVKYFNQKYQRVGHLFQDRYKSENIENDSYLLTVIRYVHQNPEKAGISRSETYKWSSYQAYLSGPGVTRYLPEMAEVLRMFGRETEAALNRFRQFHAEYNGEVCLDIRNCSEEDEKIEADVRRLLADTLQSTGLTLKDMIKKENALILKEFLLKLRNNTGLSGRKLSQLTGINRETIRRALLTFS